MVERFPVALSNEGQVSGRLYLDKSLPRFSCYNLASKFCVEVWIQIAVPGLSCMSSGIQILSVWSSRVKIEVVSLRNGRDVFDCLFLSSCVFVIQTDGIEAILCVSS